MNTGTPLIDVGKWLNQVGDDIDIDIAGAHPFAGLAKPFHDTGNTTNNIGVLCIALKPNFNWLT